MYPPATAAVLAAVFILGLVVGSFLNVVIYRLPIMLRRAWREEAFGLLAEDEATNVAIVETTETAGRFNLALPPSSCPVCGHRIRVWENIPVISYLLLRARCSACAAPISPRYPLVELASAMLSTIVVWQLGLQPVAFAAVAATWLLLALAMIDADTQYLPDILTLPLLWAGLALNSIGGFCPLSSAVWGAIAGYLVLWSVYWLFRLITGKEGMGYGDFKLLAALGAWLGWQMLPVIVILSAATGAVIGGIQLAVQGRDRQTPIPYGPYLAAAGWIAMLWGPTLLHWYLGIATGR